MPAMGLEEKLLITEGSQHSLGKRLYSGSIKVVAAHQQRTSSL